MNRPNNREAERQHWLLQTLWQRGEAPDATDWLMPLRRAQPAAPSQAAGPTLQDGVQTYRTNAYVAAHAALAASFPTVAAVVGDEPLRLLARAYRQQHPPARGDLAWFGERLPDFIAASADLAELPWLADLARLDWALTQAEAAPDSRPDLATLALLAELDPQQLRLQLMAGTTLLHSRWPVVTIRQAHEGLDREPTDPDSAAADASPSADAARWQPVRAALAAGQGETALIWRQGWRACVAAVTPAEAALLRQLLAGASLAQALAEAMPGAITAAPAPGESAETPPFDFAVWLSGALQSGLLIGAARIHDRPG